MASAAFYPPSYPAGVFLVRSKQQLAPLLSRLRATRRLKAGRNVTVFDGEHFAEVVDDPTTKLPASTPEGQGSGVVAKGEGQRSSGSADTAFCLKRTLLQLYETTEAEAAAFEMTTDPRSSKGVSGSDGATLPLPRTLSTCKAHTPVTCSIGSAVPCEPFVLTTTRGSVEGEQFLSLLRVPCAARAGAGAQWPPYMAVHVVGAFLEAEVLEFLSPGGSCGSLSTDMDGVDRRELGKSSLAVAYIYGIRRFHRVCCPVLEEMPFALAAMRRMALLQRHQRLLQGRDVAVNSTSTPPSPQEGTPSLCAVPLQRSSGLPAAVSRDPDATCTPFFTFSELFSGIGMFRSALERVGGHAAFAVEIAPPAQIVYALNHRCLHDCSAALQLPNADPGDLKSGPDALFNERSSRRGPGLAAAASAAADDHTPTMGGFPVATACFAPFLVGDITEIPSAFFPLHDVLTGGFPCQSFAKAGDAAGLYAEKGWLFYEVLRVLATTRPAAFLLENVEHLVNVEAGAQLAEILERLRHPASTSPTPALESAAVEYEVQYVVVDGGALTPQTRKRVYFFGFRVASAAEQSRAVSSDLHHPSCRFSLPRAEGGEARSAAARVVANALQQIKAASLHSPYRNVGELLVAPSTVDVLSLTSQGRSMQSASMTTPSELKSGAHRSAHSDLQLTPSQWEAVQRSRTYRQKPLWRLCDVRGQARTLMGSYRTSYQLYSEFVPYSPELTLDEVTTLLQRETLLRPENGAEDVRGGGSDDSAMAVPPSPPLRFFALRECARLQGIEDDFLLPHDTMQPWQSPGTAGAGAAVISPEVLRQVPRGAVYKLIGNAVNPRVVACLGGAIASYLHERRI
ncbi:hypothetical protein JKF63_04621 [Porcisia hertigi]|uniref:DNA (cytosine-5-)-methyltransferase n=1 Tax=Porcisia hertigi TaxID=2761500 RepID=A0A836L8F1_9TRYP|nr:hypothetical protein JKF63_04621 [Porcisia hertigi]